MIFLEVLDRRGRLLDRHRIDRCPITIGRAYANDVIVDDPYVCPTHLRLLRTDPGLPAAQLAPDWPAAASSALYRRVFDGLEPAARAALHRSLRASGR